MIIACQIMAKDQEEGQGRTGRRRSTAQQLLHDFKILFWNG